MSYLIGHSTKIYNTYGDTMCPHCSSTGNTIKVTGQLHINGQPQNTYKCGNCNAVFSGEYNGTINQLIDYASECNGLKHSVNNITWTTTNSTNDNSASIQLDYNTQSKFDQMNQKLQNIDNQFYNLLSAINSLTNEIRNLSQENHKLLEKTLTDPLINIKKQINEFKLI